MERKVRKLKYESEINIHNRFDVEIVDANTGKVKKKATGFNTILNNLWNVLLNTGPSYYAYFGAIYFGSGSGDVSNTDTDLFQRIGYKSNFDTAETVINLEVRNGVIWCRKKIVLSQDDYVGNTFREVGIGTNAGTLCTHAMLRDMNNNPIAIDKTDTDIINIYATVYVHLPNYSNNNGVYFTEGDVCGTTDALSYKNEYFYFALLGHYTNSDPRWLDNFITLRNGILGAGESYYRALTVTRDPDNKKMVFRVRRLQVNEGNISKGIQTLVMGNGGEDQNVGSADFLNKSKGAGDLFYIDITKNFISNGFQIIGEEIGTGDGEETDWDTAYELPSDFALYVNGLAVNSSEYDFYSEIDGGDVGKYFIPIRTSAAIGGPYNINWTGCINTYPVSKGPVYGKSRSYNAVYSNKTFYDIYYNPNYELGIDKIEVISAFEGYSPYADINTVYKIEVGNNINEDFMEINLLKESKDLYAFPEEHKHKKFIKISRRSTSNLNDTDEFFRNVLVFINLQTNRKKIHFHNPPLIGSVITADYKTKNIPKDSDHVLDLEFTISFNESQE